MLCLVCTRPISNEHKLCDDCTVALRKIIKELYKVGMLNPDNTILALRRYLMSHYASKDNNGRWKCRNPNCRAEIMPDILALEPSCWSCGARQIEVIEEAA